MWADRHKPLTTLLMLQKAEGYSSLKTGEHFRTRPLILTRYEGLGNSIFKYTTYVYGTLTSLSYTVVSSHSLIVSKQFRTDEQQGSVL